MRPGATLHACLLTEVRIRILSFVRTFSRSPSCTAGGDASLLAALVVRKI
jgi:hypothetical protein